MGLVRLFTNFPGKMKSDASRNCKLEKKYYEKLRIKIN